MKLNPDTITADAEFAALALERAGIALRPFVALDIPLLCELQSPLIDCALECCKPQRQRGIVHFTQDEAYEGIYQFSVSVERVRLELNTSRDHFRAQAVLAIGDRVSPGVANRLPAVAYKHLVRCLIDLEVKDMKAQILEAQNNPLRN
ncbi:MAG: hypothetical protein JWR69_4733 [Pedosphaera sp.]|nr:hypothetical protein [Pedosphaera sp.]